MNNKNTSINWRLLLIINLFFLLTHSASADKYYWVNGSGNWSEYTKHWAVKSGGQVFHVNEPTANDTVYFDANSFTALNQAVTIDVPANCAAMDWTGALYSPAVTSTGAGNQLTIHGSLTFISEMHFDFNGTITFQSNSLGNTINTAGQVIKGHVFIDGGEWLLEDSLNISAYGSIILRNNGILTTNNNNIHCHSLYATLPGYTLNLGASFIYANSIDLADNANCHFDAGTSTLIIQSLSGNFHYNRLIITGDYGNPGIKGNFMDTVEINELIVNKNKTGNAIIFIKPIANIHKAVFSGTVYVTEACVFDSLELLAGASFLLFSEKTQTIHYLSATGNYNAPITIASAFNSGKQAIILFTQDSLCLDYLRLKDIEASGTEPFYAGYHSVNNGNNTGWLFESCVQPISDVWPGDANADGTVNYLDLLYIGLAYGETGPVRANASLAWEPQPVLDWKSAFANLVNTKHADCDGNGTIDADDTVAVLRNYLEVHNKTQHTLKTSSTDPLLHISLPASLKAGQVIKTPILLGTTDVPVKDAYGLGFSINYDPLITDSASIKLSFHDSWFGKFGKDGDMIDLKKKLSTKLDAGLTKINHINVSGAGEIGTLEFVMKDDVSGKKNQTVVVSFGDVHLVSADGTELPINAEVYTVSTSIDMEKITVSMSQINVYPNPAKDKLIIEGNDNVKLKEVILSNIMGKEFIRLNLQLTKKEQINTENLPEGFYLLSVKTSEKTVIKKINIIRGYSQ